MNQKVQRHEKIRFRRGDITALKSFPSAEGQDHLMAGRPLRRRLLRGLAAVAAGGLVLLVIAALGLAFLGLTGVGSERLRHEAEAAIRRAAGVDVAASIGSTSLSLDPSRFIALEIRDVRFADSKGSEMLDAGVVRFGVRFWPLMSGQIRLGSASIGEARLVAGAVPGRGGPGLGSTLANADGLIDPDRVADLLFGSLHRAFDTMQLGSTRHISLQGVEIVLPAGGRVKSILIDTAELEQQDDGALSIAATADIDGRIVNISGSATRDNLDRRISALSLDLSAPAGPSTEGSEALPVTASRFGALRASIAGEEGADGVPYRLSASAKLGGSVLDLGRAGRLEGDLGIKANLLRGKSQVVLDSLSVTTGKSRFDFSGTMGPEAGRADGTPAAYRFDLSDAEARLAPEGSTEPPLSLAATISGTYEPLQRRLAADRLGIATAGGELSGTAAIEFADGKPPGMSVVLAISEMPVSHVKQLWPWFAAGGARKWANAHLFDGTVSDSDLNYHVAVGRLGNGVPLGHDELFGRFALRDTRFDLAGELPPMRDATGGVEFRGTDIDITIEKGRVSLAGGGQVTGKDGTLTIRRANRPPVIGDLDIDIAGEASAVAEFASQKPIDALRHVGLTAKELSGTVEGHVKADIPMQAGIDAGRLGFLVDLSYQDLAISKPLEGQLVTAADGRIVVDPAKATITAKARLNGAPAEIAMVEPLNERGPKRQRDITVTLDDKARATLVPGLEGLLSGTVKAQFSIAPDNTQTVKADVTQATVTIPWAGWSKGPGVSGSVDFTLRKDGDAVRLDDFSLSGKSFAVDGEVNLVDGALSSASFGRVKLNRDDDLSLSVKRSGKGYVVDISGDALDARAVIKQFTADMDKGASTGGADESPVPVTVDARLKRLYGFNGETLSGVAVDYSGVGSKVLRFTLTGTTKSGAQVEVDNRVEKNRRKMTMRSPDAGAFLRFLDIYEHMQGGSIRLALSGSADGPLTGSVDATNFVVVNEPRLRSIVSTAPSGDGRSLNEAVKNNIDTSRVTFERGYAEIEKGDGSLKLERGVLRGPVIGTTFQGTFYDAKGRMAMTGTFMPAYGLNRLFGELPLVGMILGNGRDRGLIGVTYKLSGDAKSPELQINPLSAIAPGIFRSIFEFR
ncbi:MAG: DUF3971 domain-containing protein [Mesorhizobium sp.]